MNKIEVSDEDLDDIIYACREAQIRFQRAKTELNHNNERYLHWNKDYLNEKICHFADLEGRMISKFEHATGGPYQ